MNSDENDINQLLIYMRKRILKDEFSIPIIFEKERTQLKELLDHTLIDGESNSCIMIGHRGSGKSHLLNTVLSHYNEKNFLLIKLNGLVHTDGVISLDEITKRMNLEAINEKRTFGNFSENFQFLLQSFKTGSKNIIPIVFVLDEFDMFCQHKNQTLLYNLFDVVQSAPMSICVVGLTVRLDVMELLEKRVKSRFSHRIIHLCTSFTYEEYLNIVTNFLKIDLNVPLSTEIIRVWNARVESILTEKIILDIFKHQFNLDKSLKALKTLLTLPILQLTNESSLLSGNYIITSFNQLNNIDSKSCVLHGLTILELCLIIAMNNLTINFDSEPFNFEMVFRSYRRFCQSKSSNQPFDRPTVSKAFEHLVQLEIVQPAVQSGENKMGRWGSMLKDFRLMQLMVDTNDINETLIKYQGCPTDVRQWANSTII